jgi:hypothetical protein
MKSKRRQLAIHELEVMLKLQLQEIAHLERTLKYYREAKANTVRLLRMEKADCDLIVSRD